MGSSLLTRDGTQAPCIGSVGSLPLDYQGSPNILLISAVWQSDLTIYRASLVAQLVKNPLVMQETWV